MQVSVLPFIHDGEDANQLMSRADRGMYTVKNLGNNRYHQFVAAQNAKCVGENKDNWVCVARRRMRKFPTICQRLFLYNIA